MTKCVQCFSDDSKVKETRFNDAEEWRIRRRHCRKCDHTYWTIEIPAVYAQDIMRQVLTNKSKAAN